MIPRWLTYMLAVWVALLGQTVLADPEPVPEPGKAWTVPDLGISMLPLPAGSYTQGDDQGLRWEKPAHQVKLTKSFWMSHSEITNAQFRTFLRLTRYDGSKQADGDYLRHFEGSDGGQAAGELPVVFVSWHSAMAFCAFVTATEKAAGRLPDGLVYRLPTEAEWEYACRAGGDDDAAGELEDMAWFDKNSGGKTHPVAGKKANSFGLHDLYGNVFEWCLDYKDEYPAAAQTDPTGPVDGDRRVVRGGGWYSPARHCRAAYRSDYPPERTSFDLGFRIVLASAVTATPAPAVPK
jgi:formylglycine-generating enzyme required for sulfatase activity